jgi:hypothetical protein
MSDIDMRDNRTLPSTQSVGYGALWAIGAILVIATVYEINRKVGVGLFILALMAMALTYVRDNNIQFTRPL